MHENPHPLTFSYSILSNAFNTCLQNAIIIHQFGCNHVDAL